MAGGEGEGALTPRERARDEPFIRAWVRSLFVSRGRRRGEGGVAGARVGGADFSDDDDDGEDSEAEDEAAAAVVQIAAQSGAGEGEAAKGEGDVADAAAVDVGADAPTPLLPPRSASDVEDAADRRIVALCKLRFWRASLLRHWNLQRSESQTVANERCYERIVRVMSAFLDACALQSDAKSASVLMIMSDTFYCLETVAPVAPPAVSGLSAAAAEGAPAAAAAAAAPAPPPGEGDEGGTPVAEGPFFAIPI